MSGIFAAVAVKYFKRINKFDVSLPFFLSAIFLSVRGSGVTEQLGALSNLAMQGPLETADRSTKVYQISTIKMVFLLAKSS